MKKILKRVIAAAFTLSTVMSALVFPTGVSAAEKSFDFENYEVGTALAANPQYYWRETGAYVMNGTATVVADPDDASNKCIKFEKGDGTPYVSINVNVEAGQTYYLTAKVRGLSTSEAGYYPRVRPSSSGSFSGTAAYSFGNWQTVIQKFTATESVLTYFDIVRYGDGGYIDELRVTKVFTDPGFEAQDIGEELVPSTYITAGEYYQMNATAAVTVDPDDSTNKCVLFTPSGTAASGIAINKEVTAGKTYYIRAKVRSNDATGRTYHLRMSSATSTELDPAVGNGLPTSIDAYGSWNTLTYEYTTNVDNTIRFEIVTWNGGGYIDGFEISEEPFATPTPEPTPTPTPEPEKITDYTFESATTGLALQSSAAGEGEYYAVNADAEIVDAVAYSGSKSVKFVRPESVGSAGAYVAVKANIEAGKTYAVTANVRSLTTANTYRFRINGALYANTDISTDWKQLVYYFTATSNKTEEFQLIVWGDGGYVDDFLITEVVTDSSFETAKTGALLTDGTNGIAHHAEGSYFIGNAAGTIVEANGNKAVRLVRNSGTTAGAYVAVNKTVTAGQLYTAVAKVKKLENVAEQEIRARVAQAGSTALDPSVAWNDHAIIHVYDDNWAEIRFPYTSNIDNTVSFQMCVWGDGMYLDDFVVYEGEPPVEFGISKAEFAYSEDDVTYSGAYKTDIKNGYYKYTITVNNPNADDAVFTPIIALYSADGMLVNVNAAQTSVAAGARGVQIPVKLSVSAAAAGMYIKTFVWDSMDAMTPCQMPPVKVLIIGNSITQHSQNLDIGWKGTWGMAATSEDKDYVHQLIAKAEAKTANVEFMWKNISEFEKYFYDWNQFNASAYDELVNFDADIIIATFGANIKNGANESDPSFENSEVFKAQHYTDIVNHFNSGSAQVIVGLTPLTPTGNIEIITQSANENGWALVDMSDLTAEKYTAKPYKGADVFTAAVTADVLGHPGDAGMAEMANRLWTPLETAIDNAL